MMSSKERTLSIRVKLVVKGSTYQSVRATVFETHVEAREMDVSS